MGGRVERPPEEQKVAKNQFGQHRCSNQRPPLRGGGPCKLLALITPSLQGGEPCSLQHKTPIAQGLPGWPQRGREGAAGISLTRSQRRLSGSASRAEQLGGFHPGQRGLLWPGRRPGARAAAAAASDPAAGRGEARPAATEVPGNPGSLGLAWVAGPGAGGALWVSGSRRLSGTPG